MGIQLTRYVICRFCFGRVTSKFAIALPNTITRSARRASGLRSNALATADPFHVDEVGISDKWSENGVLST